MLQVLLYFTEILFIMCFRMVRPRYFYSALSEHENIPYTVPTHPRMKGNTVHPPASRSEQGIVSFGIFHHEAVTLSCSFVPTDELLGLNIPYKNPEKYTANTLHISQSSNVHPAALVPAWYSDFTRLSIF